MCRIFLCLEFFYAAKTLRYSNVKYTLYMYRTPFWTFPIPSLMLNIPPELHYSTSQLRKLKMKILILFFFLLFFFFLVFPHAYLVTQKLHGVYKRSVHQTTALLSAICLFWVRTACDLRPRRYGPKHASWSLSHMPFVHAFMYSLKTKVVRGCSAYRRLFYDRRHSLCGLEFHEKSIWRGTAPAIHRGRSLIQHYRSYTASPCT